MLRIAENKRDVTTAEMFTCDADGNLIEDGQFVYTWDGENRLIQVETRIEVGTSNSAYEDDDVRVKFRYDYMGRRIEKRVYLYDSGWPADNDPDQVLRFVYDGWNVVMVLDGLDDNAIIRKYTWGLDLSGQRGHQSPDREGGVPGIHGAGGIGGLLAVEETATSGTPKYWFLYEANGNVGQLVENASGHAVAARYEYDAYGAVIGPDTDSDGDWQDDATAVALANPIRFSTKWFDEETGLHYYGYRYLGERWLNRDPIEENGGANLYAFVHNSPALSVDPSGLLVGAPPAPAPPVVALPVASFCIGYGIGTAICHCTKIDEGLGWVIWKCNPWAPKPTPWTPPIPKPKPKPNPPKPDCKPGSPDKCDWALEWCQWGVKCGKKDEYGDNPRKWPNDTTDRDCQKCHDQCKATGTWPMSGPCRQPQNGYGPHPDESQLTYPIKPDWDDCNPE